MTFYLDSLVKALDLLINRLGGKRAVRLYLIVLMLCLGFVAPQKAHAAIIPNTTEVGIVLPTFKIVDTLKAQVQPVQPLQYAPFHFDPMGTHDSSYVLGQCTWGAASMKGDVPSWGNANQWDDGARAAGITVSDTPIVGAIAQTDRGYYGHVAVVDAVTPTGQAEITEMNYDGRGIGSVRTRLVTPGEFVYIYLN